MKIGDECWVVPNSDGSIGLELIVGRPAIGVYQTKDDVPDHIKNQPVRVRIVPADCTETHASTDKSGGLGTDDGWQTMESAPKDGTEVLVWIVEEAGCRVAFYNGCAWDGGSGAYDLDPTHWQPLPPPPETE